MTYIVWTEEENNYIKTNYHILSDVKLAQGISLLRNGKEVSKAAARKQRQRLGLMRDTGKKKGVTRCDYD